MGWVGDETPWQLGAVFASPKTLGNKALVTKLLAALARADREYHDVILASVRNGNAEIDEKTKPLLEIIAKYTNLPVEQVVGNCAYIDPDGKLDVKMSATRSSGCSSRVLSTRDLGSTRSSRRNMSRRIDARCYIRHCERSEAIHCVTRARKPGLLRPALAMTAFESADPD